MQRQSLLSNCCVPVSYYSNDNQNRLQINESYKKFNRKAQNKALLDSLREPSSKYPLESSWSFWFFKNYSGPSWEDNLIKLTTVDSVEDFWSVFNYLKPVEDIADGIIIISV